MPFNVNKCHILQIGTKNKELEYEMNSLNSKVYNVSKILALQLCLVLNSPSNAKILQVKLIGCWVLYTKISPLSFKNKDLILPLYIS